MNHFVILIALTTFSASSVIRSGDYLPIKLSQTNGYHISDSSMINRPILYRHRLIGKIAPYMDNRFAGARHIWKRHIDTRDELNYSSTSGVGTLGTLIDIADPQQRIDFLNSTKDTWKKQYHNPDISGITRDGARVLLLEAALAAESQDLAVQTALSEKLRADKEILETHYTEQLRNYTEQLRNKDKEISQLRTALFGVVGAAAILTPIMWHSLRKSN